MRDRDLPGHPLAERGYPSIGCWPCTRPVGDGRGPPRRPLGRHRQDGVRPPRLSTTLVALAPRYLTAASRPLADSELADSAHARPRSRATRVRPERRRLRAGPAHVSARGGGVARRAPAHRARARASSTSPPAPASSPGSSTPPVRDLVGGRAGRGHAARLRPAMCPGVPDRRGDRRGSSRSPTARSTRSPSPRRSTGSTPSARSPSSRRVLRPGGRLGLVWNARDRSVDLGRPAVVDHGPGREAGAVAASTRSGERLRVRRARRFGDAARGDVPPRAAADAATGASTASGR